MCDAITQQQSSKVFTLEMSSYRPKTACERHGLTEVTTTLIEAEVPEHGDLLLGMADGGIPVDVRTPTHWDVQRRVTPIEPRCRAGLFW